MVSRSQEVSPDAEQMLHDPVNPREPLELSGRREPPHLRAGTVKCLADTLKLCPICCVQAQTRSRCLGRYSTGVSST